MSPRCPLPQGDVQQLLLVADPEAARSYCHLYMPDCHQPLLYPLIAPFPEEVSAQTGEGDGWDPTELHGGVTGPPTPPFLSLSPAE